MTYLKNVEELLFKSVGFQIGVYCLEAHLFAESDENICKSSHSLSIFLSRSRIHKSKSLFFKSARLGHSDNKNIATLFS